MVGNKRKFIIGKERKMKERDFVSDIKSNYRKLERELVTQLSYQIDHHPVSGTNREEIWVDFFRRMIPQKFNIARSVFIIDSHNNCSKEVDIAIYDEQYTPYIFNYGCIKFIPVEAVAAVIQCKSRSLNKANLKPWVKSIKGLKTSQDSIVRLANYIHIGDSKLRTDTNDKNQNIQTATTPIKILCFISEVKTTTKYSYGRKEFDIVIEAFQKTISNEENGNLKITFNKNKNLYDVLCQYNRADKETNNQGCSLVESRKEVLESRKIEDFVVRDGQDRCTLLSFIFQFNQMIMLINNPMFFPHKSYVDMFNGKTK